GIDQQALEAVLEQVVHGLPVHARALHGHVGHPVGLEPIPQGQQLHRRGAEGPHVLDALTPRPRYADAGRNGSLVYIQTAAALDQPIHSSPSRTVSSGTGGASVRASLLCVLMATMRGADSSHVRLRVGLRRTKQMRRFRPSDVSRMLHPFHPYGMCPRGTWEVALKNPGGRGSRSCDAFEGDAVALALEGLNGAAAEAVQILTRVVVRAQLLIGRPASEHVVDGDEQSV